MTKKLLSLLFAAVATVTINSSMYKNSLEFRISFLLKQLKQHPHKKTSHYRIFIKILKLINANRKKSVSDKIATRKKGKTGPRGPRLSERGPDGPRLTLETAAQGPFPVRGRTSFAARILACCPQPGAVFGSSSDGSSSVRSRGHPGACRRRTPSRWRGR